jgi:type III pantothenate kinase
MEFGIFEKENLLGSFRLGHQRDITSDEVGLFACQFFQGSGLDRRDIDDIIIASVVPQVMYSINNAIKNIFSAKMPLVIGDDLSRNIVNLYDNPKSSVRTAS